MNDQTTPTGTPAPRRRRWKTPAIVAGVLAVGFTGAVATTAFSQGGFGPARWHQGPMGMGQRGPIDPARLDTMIEHGVKHLAVDIDATADQTTKLVAIAQSAAKDLLPVRQQVEAAREKGRTLLVSPTLDRAAIESYRAEQVALADQVSKRIAQAVGDAAEVLTPAQRIKLVERFPRLAGRGMGMGGPGMGGPGRDGHRGPGGPGGYRDGQRPG